VLTQAIEKEGQQSGRKMEFWGNSVKEFGEELRTTIDLFQLMVTLFGNKFCYKQRR
jgi:hypothetical protein